MSPTPFTAYQRRLFVFLAVATFFEGYDFIALTQILPDLRAEFGISKAGAGLMFAIINLGTVAAWVVIRQADRVGRRGVLMVTILGYTLCTLLSGLSQDVYQFTVFQCVGRVFLIGEWTTAMVYAAEEYPADRRGMVIGVLQAFSSLGALVCAATVPLMVTLPLGWRTVYLVGVLPLLLLAYARRGLKETSRFAAEKDRIQAEKRPVMGVMRGPYRRRILQLGAIWFLTYVCSNTAIAFWKDYAVSEKGMSNGEVATVLTVAALVSMPLIFGAGKLLDLIGRRRSALLILTSAALGAVLIYGVEGTVPLILAMTLAIFGISSTLPLLNAFTVELMPTDIRSDAFGWSNNLIGRIGYVISPLFVGWAADQWGYAAAIQPLAVFPLLALVLILLWLPETNQLELEASATL